MTSAPGGGRLLHVTVVARRLDESLDFYDATLGELGIERTVEYPDEEEGADGAADAVGFGRDAVISIWLVSGTAATCGVHVAFAATSAEQVDRFWTAALANGGTGRQAPRAWEIYRPGYYGAIVADPDGNLVEAVFDAG